MVYADDMIVRDALQLYFSKYHFENGGYHLKWFKIKIGPLFIPLPNTKARVEAVKLHDLHHIATEYPATLKGEAEIGGWEIASGCGKYYAAWILNTGSFFLGLLFFPKALFRAFMKGRNSRPNLYQNTTYDDQLLNKTVGELRANLGLNISYKHPLTDYLLFVVYGLFTLSLSVAFFYGLCSGIERLLG